MASISSHPPRSAATTTTSVPPLPSHVDPKTAPRPGMLHISQALKMSDTIARQHARTMDARHGADFYEHVLELGCWAVENKLVACFDELLIKMVARRSVRAVAEDATELNKAVGNLALAEESYPLLLNKMKLSPKDASIDLSKDALLKSRKTNEEGMPVIVEDDAEDGVLFRKQSFMNLIKMAVDKNRALRDSIIGAFSEAHAKVRIRHKIHMWTRAGSLIATKAANNPSVTSKMLWGDLFKKMTGVPMLCMLVHMLEQGEGDCVDGDNDDDEAEGKMLVQHAACNAARFTVLFAEFKRRYDEKSPELEGFSVTRSRVNEAKVELDEQCDKLKAYIRDKY